MCRRPCRRIGFDVDHGNHPLIYLGLGTDQSRLNFTRFLNVFTVATQGLSHLVVSCVAQIPAWFVLVRVSCPPAVQTDYHQ
ncbi:uncharacterized protein METZ01_LOCUS476934 [marine metagenome]|uniref:Uncharacterized protein n=1 Tax=marine metagenome TaxID=408172 RepID=A0A383BW81_9ZZZZ